MRIPKFWARATHDGFEVSGFSFTSQAEAVEVAEQRAVLLAQVIAMEREPEGIYLYGDRPVREPVIETLGDASRPEAAVTRNSYGALCLNTEDVAFVDVDHNGNADKALARIRRAHAAQPRWALKTYRTRAGYRVVAVHSRIGPASSEAQELFDALGADPLYRKLCAQQESFRARLTPKPWRIGLRRMPGQFPWRDSSVERAVEGWVGEYDEASRAFSVCEIVDTLGHTSMDPVIDRVLRFHDQRVLGGKPLA